MTNDNKKIVNLQQIAPAMLVEKKVIVLFSKNSEMNFGFCHNRGHLKITCRKKKAAHEGDDKTGRGTEGSGGTESLFFGGEIMVGEIALSTEAVDRGVARRQRCLSSFLYGPRFFLKPLYAVSTSHQPGRWHRCCQPVAHYFLGGRCCGWQDGKTTVQLGRPCTFLTCV